jgi:hypothetical protein
VWCTSRRAGQCISSDIMAAPGPLPSPPPLPRPQRVLGKEVATIWEGQRWWVGLGFLTVCPRFVPDGEQDSGCWKGTRDAVAPSAAIAKLKDKAQAFKDSFARGMWTGPPEEQVDRPATEAAAVSVDLLQAANASLASDPTGEYADLVAAVGGPCRWQWSCDDWEVVRDGSTDDAGWCYATDWPRFASPRPGGRKSQRSTDVVRRRRIARTMLLVIYSTPDDDGGGGSGGCSGDGTLSENVGGQLGGEEGGGVMGATKRFQVQRAAEIESEKQAHKSVLGVSRVVTGAGGDNGIAKI